MIHTSPDARPSFAFLAAGLSAFMGTLDSSIVNVVLPTLAAEFRADLSTVAWVVQSYLLVTMAFLLIGGRLLDLLGARRVLILGFALFTAGSLACALSTTIPLLVLARAFQGLGAAVLMGVNQGIVARAFPPDRRGRFLGLIGTVVAIGLATGPPLGGLLVETLGWRSIFYLNLPVGVGAVIFVRFAFPRRLGGMKTVSFDRAGSALIATGIGALFLGLHLTADRGWTDAVVVSLLAGSLGMLALFLWNEHRLDHPLFPIGLFRKRYFSQSCAAAFFAFFALMTALVFMPFYMQDLLGFSPGRVGMVMMTLPLAMLLVAPAGGYISDRIGSKIPATAGMALVATGLFLLVGLDRTATAWDLISRLVFIGVGMGCFGSPNTRAILSSAPPEETGAVSGLSALLRTAGFGFGLAFAAMAFTFFRTRFEEGGITLPILTEGVEDDSYLAALRCVFLCGAMLAATNGVNSALRGRNPRASRVPLGVRR